LQGGRGPARIRPLRGILARKTTPIQHPINMKFVKIAALAAAAVATLFAASCCPNAAPAKPAYVAPAK